EKYLLGDEELKDLQKRINKFRAPSGICRIPSKITSSFKVEKLGSGMFALRDILPDRHLQCWKLFVKASRIFVLL
ncbi:hypothetical protein pdam_00024717, partial [Pocillopora damicornis]